MNALLLIGEPGAGKTTLFEYLTAGLPYEEYGQPFAYRRYDAGPLEIGKRREGGFSGTDALSMSVQPIVEQWVEDIKPRLLMAEGDRLANDKFLSFLNGIGYTVHLYQLWGSAAAAQQRAARGSKQDPQWVQGRVTKVTGLRKRWDGIVLPAGKPVAELAARMDDPVSQVLRDAKAVLV